MGKSVLLSKIRTEIRRQNMGYRTEQTYIGWITRFIYYHNLKHPQNLGEQEVVEFLNHLVIERELPDSIRAQAQRALMFLYERVLNKPLSDLEGVIKGETPYMNWFDKSHHKQQITAT